MTQAFFTLLLGMGLAFYLSWQLALAALPFVPLCVLGTYVESLQTSGNMAKEKSDQESGNQVRMVSFVLFIKYLYPAPLRLGQR